MIILSGVLVVIAIALLIAGIVVGETGGEIANLVDGMTVIYLSIAVSIVSFLCLLIGVFLRRKELFGAGIGATGTQSRRRGRPPARSKATPTRSEASEPALEPTPAPDVPAGATVFVIPGRKRYHLETCRQLAARDKQELTYEEAMEEGFSACTACLPDTALAARAASEDNGSEDADTVVDVMESVAVDDNPADGADTAQFAVTSVTPSSNDTDLTGSADSPYAAQTAAEPVAPAVGHYGTSAPSRESRRPGRHAAAAPQHGASSTSDVLVLAGTRRYHRPDCALIEDIATEDEAGDLEMLSAAAAQAKGYTACLVCRPEKEPAHD